MGRAISAADRVAAITGLWSDGDYRRIAALFAPISEQLAANWAGPGLRVLDAATGTGNTALAFARAGAEVDAFDLTPTLLDIAERRAAEQRLRVRFRQGDLVAIPYDDATFELVVSTFGAFLADQQQACARELVRVCRPGGTIVTTGWSGEGAIGVLTAVTVEHHPDLRDPAAPDVRVWSDPDRLPGLFAGCDVEVSLERRTAEFTFASAEQAMEVFETTSGPVRALRTNVERAGRDWSALRQEIVRRWTALARPTGDGIALPSVYGVAVVRRRS
ncbi:class I SAM-dependent methyltransferase [Egicoccus halophilus]|uniref:Methyltransferase n=1 Tax=Egicoccus halophilus TaxID=1670830 RepID=A0A8J3ETP6_9ACTN|nr:class I SAM-dependent methyltransferase [Egicoccus halophilus]GGI05591.1 methyltransferase [Egicoccus halophilus]